MVLRKIIEGESYITEYIANGQRCVEHNKRCKVHSSAEISITPRASVGYLRKFRYNGIASEKEDILLTSQYQTEKRLS